MKMNELSQLMPFCDANGRLTALPAKHKKKLMALWYLAGKIAAGRRYTEPEINDLLDEWTRFHDPATLRRECIASGHRIPQSCPFWKNYGYRSESV